MDRRRVLGLMLLSVLPGCRGRQHAHILDNDDPDMIGSHAAGAATWKPLVKDATGRLLGRHANQVVPVSGTVETLGHRRRICFVGVENCSSEELGDFREQIYELVDTTLSQSQVYAPVSRRFIDAGLKQTRLRPDELFLPRNRAIFASALEEMDAPFDFLLFAKITSGTTQSNKSNYQRDYTLTLEMVDVRTGDYDKESANIRKGYHTSVLGRVKHYTD